MRHLLGRAEELGHVEAHDRGRHHAEIAQRGVAAADAAAAEEHAAEVMGLGRVLHLGAGIGDGHEALAGLGRPHRHLHALEEVLAQGVRLQRAARLAGDDHQRAGQVELALDGLHLGRIGGVDEVQLGEAGRLAERPGQRVDAEHGAAHADEQRVGEASGARVLGRLLEMADQRELVVGGAQPAEPPALVGARPQRGVAGP